MRSATRARVADALATALGATTIKLGTSSQEPTDEDVGIVGDTVATATGIATTNGTEYLFLATIIFAVSAIINEVAIFDSQGALLDRFLVPGINVQVGGKLKIEWAEDVF